MTQGYYRWPTVYQDKVVFVCEDDLWIASLQGGDARRLTSGLGQISCAAFSPNGQQIAFTGTDEGHQEVYVIPASGGHPRRLTHFGALVTRVFGWTPDSQKVLCHSSANQMLRRMVTVYAVDTQGGEPQNMGYGMAHQLVYGPNGAKVVGRHSWDPARWKRYKGGTKGFLWVDTQGNDDFKRLIELDGGMATPMWIGARIYFVADHEGVGNLYSTTADGQDLKRHTHHVDYYVRFPSTDGTTIVYHAGGDIYAYDVASGKSQVVPIAWNSPQVQRYRKFVSPSRYLNTSHLHPEGHSVALTVRGKPLTMGLWEGVALQHGQTDGVRYRTARYVHDGKRLVVISDESGEENLEVFTIDGSQPPAKLENFSLGRPEQCVVSPVKDQVAIVNHRRELILVDLDQMTARILDQTPHHNGIDGVSWSPDGEWLAYGYYNSHNTSVIKLCQVETGETTAVTRPVLQDFAPAFDPEGKYLYFISSREFSPVYDEMHFALGFPYGTRPYALPLQKDVRSPFHPDEPKPPRPEPKKDKEGDKDADKADKEANKIKKITIDLAGITERLVAFPVREGRYRQIVGLPGGKVMYMIYPVEGTLEQMLVEAEPKPKGALKLYDFTNREEETLLDGVSSVAVSANNKAMMVRVNNKLRVLPAGEKPPEKPAEGRKSGWVDLERIKLQVVPHLEWQQMYGDAWRRMRDHFWTADMSGVDWQLVHDRYAALLPRLGCRSEFSDLVWEMQGELGTSHAYEMGGDYRSEPKYHQGFLGADFVWDEAAQGYRITHLVRGDYWDEKKGCPLAKPGLNVHVGDVITAIQGRHLSPEFSPGAALVHYANTDIVITVAGETPRNVQVRTSDSDTMARYRDWVESNRQYVHEKTGGKIGYVHIPDMGPWGFAEFHRYYLSECGYDGLLVDVRFNGGGHVSQLILDKLRRRPLGYDISRWGCPESYPSYAVLGPMLALTDENAGSDGDIFSHSFKMLKLGPLVGKRTWGGVIGINSQGRLMDGSLTTQPEYSFWFHDVGWGVENYGTDPDIEVDYPPQAYKQGYDPQLERAIAELEQMLSHQKPALPDFSKRPRLTLPKSLP